MKPLSVICFRLLVQLISCAFRFADDSAGSSSAARTAMMAMTTSNSIRVNPRGEFLGDEGLFTSDIDGYGRAWLSPRRHSALRGCRTIGFRSHSSPPNTTKREL